MLPRQRRALVAAKQQQRDGARARGAHWRARAADPAGRRTPARARRRAPRPQARERHAAGALLYAQVCWARNAWSD
eukprot:1599937-Rhodomonas_salina.1